MNATQPIQPPAHALVDGAGRLVEAEAPLAALNTRAGGRLGAPLAVPQIATLVRLAQRLDIMIARGIVAADGEDELELWVRAEPAEEGAVRLAVSGWTARSAWTPAPGELARRRDFARSEALWTWETDAALNLTFASLATATRHGFEVPLGQPLTRLFALDADPEGGFPILGGLAQHRGFEAQLATIRATGEQVRLAATPRTDARGGFAGFAGAVHPRQDAAAPGAQPEAVLSQGLATRLEAALRSPLDRIIANADSISAKTDGPLGQHYADYAADIATAGRHLAGLVDDLVDLHYIERDDFVVAREALDLADVARRTAGLFGVRATDAKVAIDAPGAGERLPATGEFRRALQVLVNLVGNALRYSPAGGTVWIRVQAEGDVAAVIVADQGKGIAAEDHPRIFDKFERVDPREPGGSGLGLYIARRLARAMGGDLTVDSAPGEGARFVFTLPLRS